jgi:hypothetical protein
VSLLLAVVLLAQLREHQGVMTYFVFGDLRWAFDGASHDGTLLACYFAGVVGVEWQLLDDFIFHERQFVQLAGVASAFFHLTAGAAQGRRFSVHAFNALLRWLWVACDAVGLSARALLPPFAKEALDASHVRVPVTLREALPSREPVRVSAAVVAVVAAAAADSEHWPQARQQTIDHLAGLESLTDRIDVIERLGEFAMVFFQYVNAGIQPPRVSAQREL